MIIPQLPLDVERQIIEITAEVNQATAVQLVRVCQAYRRWTVPAMYRVVVLKSSDQAKKLLGSLESAASQGSSPRLPLPLSDYIEILNFSNDIEISTVSDILPFCHNVITVGYWRVRSKIVPGPQLDVSKNLSLRRLSLDLSHLSSTNDLARVTHLDICSPVVSAWYPLLPQLTNLSHLFICEDELSNIPHRLEAILPHFPPSLRVFAIHVSRIPDPSSIQATKAILLGEVDVRVVVVSESEWAPPGLDVNDGTAVLCRPFKELLSDWCHMSSDGVDIWNRAEALIERRRQKAALQTLSAQGCA